MENITNMVQTSLMATKLGAESPEQPKTAKRNEETGPTEPVLVSQDHPSAPSTDEYIAGEEPPSPGIYLVSKDNDGNPRIMFDDSNKPEDRNVSESCTSNTDKVEAEIKQLKEKKASLEQQIVQAENQPDKQRVLQRQLSQVESELRLKDTDSYKRQHAQYT